MFNPKVTIIFLLLMGMQPFLQAHKRICTPQEDATSFKKQLINFALAASAISLGILAWSAHESGLSYAEGVAASLLTSSILLSAFLPNGGYYAPPYYHRGSYYHSYCYPYLTPNLYSNHMYIYAPPFEPVYPPIYFPY